MSDKWLAVYRGRVQAAGRSKQAALNNLYKQCLSVCLPLQHGWTVELYQLRPGEAVIFGEPDCYARVSILPSFTVYEGNPDEDYDDEDRMLLAYHYTE